MTFLITADVHGSISTWLALEALMAPTDALVVAGDLFDTRFGHVGHPDFDPESIRRKVTALPRPFYYVYGNCDEPSFFPKQQDTLMFTAFGRQVFLHHGHRRSAIPPGADIVIEGHTHNFRLENQDGRLIMNPGSMARPKNGPATYGILTESEACIVALKTLTPIAALQLP